MYPIVLGFATNNYLSISLRPAPYDIRVIRAVRALRELRQLKLINMAHVLGVTESYYCKIENGHNTITMSQLKLLAEALGVSVFLIMALAEADCLQHERIEPLSDILLDFIRKAQASGATLTDEDVGVILTKIAISVPPKTR